MKKYTTYDTDTSTALVTGKPYPHIDGVSIPSGMPENLVLLLEVTEAKPTYDSATHKLVKDEVNYNTIDKTATKSWSVVALTQAEP